MKFQRMDATGRDELGLQGRNVEVKENREQLTASRSGPLYTYYLQGPHQVNLECSRLMVGPPPDIFMSRVIKGSCMCEGCPGVHDPVSQARKATWEYQLIPAHVVVLPT